MLWKSPQMLTVSLQYFTSDSGLFLRRRSWTYTVSMFPTFLFVLGIRHSTAGFCSSCQADMIPVQFVDLRLKGRNFPYSVKHYHGFVSTSCQVYFLVAQGGFWYTKCKPGTSSPPSFPSLCGVAAEGV